MTARTDGSDQALGRVEAGDYRLFALPDVPRGARQRYVFHFASVRNQTFQTDTIRADRGTMIDVRLDSRLRRSRWSSF